MDINRLKTFPSATAPVWLARRMITTSSARIVDSFRASPWEVFLRPAHAARLCIYYRPHRPSQPKKGK